MSRIPRNVKTPMRAYNYAVKAQQLGTLKRDTVNRLEVIVINDPYWAYRFASDIKMSDKNKMQKAVLKSPEASYKFAKYVRNADIKLLEKHMGAYLQVYNEEIIKDIIE